MPSRVAEPVKFFKVSLETRAGLFPLAWPLLGSRELREVQREAIAWTHVLRNRTRWIRSAAGAADQDAKVHDFLIARGLDQTQLSQIAQAGKVRVNISFVNEEFGWEARILPWEFILSAATRSLRAGPLTVTRWLERGGNRVMTDLSKLLFVESAPGRLAHEWDFTDECRLVRTYSNAKKFEHLKSPTLDQLRETVIRFKPAIIHLAGFDTHQGLELLKDSRNEEQADGYLLSSTSGVDPVNATRLVEAVTLKGYAPTFVFFNFWNSAARLASAITAAGASAAIGFQDGMDDALAEIFLGSFYRSFGAAGDLQAGFDAGWSALQPQRKPLRGTGIVLWSGGKSDRLHIQRQSSGKQLASQACEVPLAANIGAHELASFISVAVDPEPQFSYGLLHNNRDLFRRFLIMNLKNAPLRGLEVFVELHSNEGTYPWRQTFSLNDPVLDLSRKVRLALTSNLARTLDEVLRTSLYVRVKWGPHEVFSETFPVTMAPVDQWADTNADRMFLPSFVFPRDGAIAAVLRHGEHFVTALRDDPRAGFDGYQSIDQDATDPAANVDFQVQALWYSIVYKVPASYINPPPTYALASQRIRTPSEVTGGGYGTCIDLALMLAACLEAVEIHAVVFLLNDHAFPGYWRTDSARLRFLRSVTESINGTEGVAPAAAATAYERPGVPWSFEGEALLKQIRHAIDNFHLIPVEAVGLSGRWSLSEAIVHARKYFSNEQSERFLSMIDLKTAREQGVTPLPLGARLRQ
ncbi:hypothetical protein [Pseudorhodoferax sp.]|uniref:hypothetical protein n=1 Tax=Pseudorhodoferax sp. TaxID=1993553 RepID=UPI0039E61869